MLCFACHRRLHDGDPLVRKRVDQLTPTEYLYHYTKRTAKQYFADEGMTKADYYDRMHKENVLKYMEDYE